MNKCISCIKPSKDLNKGYCGKCETVINNRLQKARSAQDHKAINDLRKNDLRIGADKVKEPIIICSKCDFTFNAKDVCQNCKRCIDCCPSWERQNC